MNKNLLYSLFLFLFFSTFSFAQGITANHQTIDLSQIPGNWIDSAKAKLHIAYGHTSHGSQLTEGMEGLEQWKGEKYAINNGGAGGALDLHDYAFSSYGANDLGNPNRTAWEQATRDYLDTSINSVVNVVMWSWCGQVDADSEEIALYLSLMTGLENDYPLVKFIYMTGHLNGTGVNGNVNQRNEQIRTYCRQNDKILFDFADIESYDPDGNYYLDKAANDQCDYDSDGNGSLDKNWAVDWQESHIEEVDWYPCGSAHSEPVNANMKAYACWWLWARLAGWDAPNNVYPDRPQISYNLNQNFPNPFNPGTIISWNMTGSRHVKVIIYDMLGREVALLLNEERPAGYNKIEFNGEEFPSGIYIYTLRAGSFSESKKMILLK